MISLILSNKERELLLIIARTGFYCSAYNKHFNISNYLLNKMLNKDFIEKEMPTIVFGKMMSVYVLTSKGKDITKNQLLIRPYNSESNQIEHDFVLGKVYGMINEKERDTWVTESDLRFIYTNETVADGLYINNKNEKVGVEIVTKNYREDIIKAKENFIKKHCDKKVMINIRDLD